DYKVFLPDLVEESTELALDIVRDELLDPAAGHGADMVSFRADGEGAVTRSVRDKLGDVVSIKDYGAQGDGSTDDTTAFVAWAAAMGPSSGRQYVPSGHYIINEPLYVPSGAVFDLVLADGAVLDFSGASLGSGPAIRIGAPSSSLT